MDSASLIAPFEDGKKAKKFCEKFIEAYTIPAFGAISKTEIDNVVFGLLIKSESINPNLQVYEIARKLNITPTKTRNLLFQWQLRNSDDSEKLKEGLRDALQSVRFGKDGSFLVFGIESPILREEFRSRLKNLGVFADASFSSEIVRLKMEHFVEFLDGFLNKETKEKMREALVKDGQVKDPSFKASAIRIMKHFAEKAIGPDGGEMVNFVEQLFQGNPNALRDGEALATSEE